MEYLSPLDASFLDAEDEDRHASLAIASIAVADGPPPGQAEFAEAIRGRLPLVPRYRQKVRRVPFNLGPAGVGRRPRLRPRLPPAPYGPAGPWRRHRPCAAGWPDHVAAARPGTTALGGLGDRRTAGGTLGAAVQGAPLHGRRRHRQPAVPPDVRHLAGARARRHRPLAAAPGRAARSTSPSTRSASWPVFPSSRCACSPGRPVPRAWSRRRRATPCAALPRIAGAFAPGTPTSLSGPLGRARRYAVARAPLAGIKSIAKKHGVTVNDVYLAAVAGAFRHLMLARGEEPARRRGADAGTGEHPSPGR